MNAPYTPDQAEIESSRAPLMEHLVELRKRLVVCLVALVIGFGVCFVFAKPIYKFLLEPFSRAAGLVALQKAGHHSAFDPTLFLALVGLHPLPASQAQPISMIYTAPLEFLLTQVKLAAFGAVVLAFPVLAFQLYRFVAPGLYKRERNAFLPFLIASPILFLLGAAMVYYIMLPFVLWFSLSQQIVDAGQVSVQLMPKVSDFFNLVTTLGLAFGLCFQLPVVLSLVGMAGMISSKTLAGARRYAVVGVFALAAVLTPPDPISMCSLGVPLVLLYEISIWCVWLIERGKVREQRAQAKAAA